jgi:hypothetical protein
MRAPTLEVVEALIRSMWQNKRLMDDRKLCPLAELVLYIIPTVGIIAFLVLFRQMMEVMEATFTTMQTQFGVADQPNHRDSLVPVGTVILGKNNGPPHLTTQDRV